MRRFFEEARSGSEVAHPKVVQGLDFRAEDVGGVLFGLASAS